ncbi:hypothetical protein [Thauera sinica]|uniref:Uncharacterized protein n=1 Tax=Thauera sinica TaxID=2665146 RepID=A0ABW1AMJ7_9RHOO|nr:hypothetical protein [Thauera sp. K11]ATE60930.1 hypothetical protein CCZ27_14155 [Thauera sp. K11]
MISTLLYLVLLWLLATLACLLGRHASTLRALWREPALRHPVLIVESDDWGTGPPGDAAMLRRIAAVLQRARDETGRPAVMTLGVVGGQPDGASMLAAGLARYVRRTLDEPEFAPIVAAMQAGCAAGVFALQRHGLEHCWPASVLERAREDAALQRWLADPAARSEALPPALQSRWIDAAALPSRPLPPERIRAAVDEEAHLLQALFGKAPMVAVPNTFVWNDDVERAWVASGVTCIVTGGRRFEGRGADGALQRPVATMRNGDRSRAGAMLLVRDDYFEPVRGHRAERVWQSVGLKCLLGRPALLETHRESFIASPEIAGQALAELERALQGALERHPRLRFMSTEELAGHLADPASPLREQRWRRRARAFLFRAMHEAALARILKYSGLGAVLRVLAPVPGGVKHGRIGAEAG